MRHINKRRYLVFDNYIAEKHFDLYLETYLKDESISLHPWQKFSQVFESREVKRDLSEHLLSEQKELCVYCQQHLVIASPHTKLSDISHIEHIKPKARGRYPQDTFNQKNIVLSCNGFNCKAIAEPPEFCGHNKNQLYDELRFLNPVQKKDLEQYFDYTFEGEIRPSPSLSKKDRQKANYMIEILDLQNPVLVNMRKDAFSDVIDYEEDEIAELLDDSYDSLPGFFSMLKQLLTV